MNCRLLEGLSIRLFKGLSKGLSETAATIYKLIYADNDIGLRGFEARETMKPYIVTKKRAQNKSICSFADICYLFPDFGVASPFARVRVYSRERKKEPTLPTLLTPNLRSVTFRDVTSDKVWSRIATPHSYL